MGSALGVLALVACSSAGLEEPDEPSHEPPLAASPGTQGHPPPGAVDGAPDGHAVAPSQPQLLPQPQGSTPRAPLPGFPAAPVLGTPCVAGQTRVPVDPCGTQGRVALAIDPARALFVRVPSCALVDLVSTKGSGNAGEIGGMFPTQACTSAEEVFAAEGCAMCRVPGAGWSAQGRIAEMTDAQHLHLQKQLGLSTSAPFRTASAWRSAIARASRK